MAEMFPDASLHEEYFLWEKEAFSRKVKLYKRRKWETLLEVLGEVRAGQQRLSGRVVSVWAYQRGELEWAS